MSNSAPYRIELDRQRAIVSLLPALNEVAWADIERIGTEALGQLAELKNPRLVIDLTALNYMGSAQVALVVRLYKSIKERDGKMVVANRHPLVLEVLTLAGLNKLWTIVEDRNTALKLLGGGGGETDGASSAATWSGLAGVAALAVAAVALVAIVTEATWLPGGTALKLELAAAAAAFGLGLFGLLKGSRVLGTCVVVGSVAVLLAGVFSLGAMKRSPAGPSSPESPPPAADAADTPETVEPTPAAQPEGEPDAPQP